VAATRPSSGSADSVSARQSLTPSRGTRHGHSCAGHCARSRHNGRLDGRIVELLAGALGNQSECSGTVWAGVVNGLTGPSGRPRPRFFKGMTLHSAGLRLARAAAQVTDELRGRDVARLCRATLHGVCYGAASQRSTRVRPIAPAAVVSDLGRSRRYASFVQSRQYEKRIVLEISSMMLRIWARPQARCVSSARRDYAGGGQSSSLR
jgi:hypothetical protein